MAVVGTNCQTNGQVGLFFKCPVAENYAYFTFFPWPSLDQWMWCNWPERDAAPAAFASRRLLRAWPLKKKLFILSALFSFSCFSLFWPEPFHQWPVWKNFPFENLAVVNFADFECMLNFDVVINNHTGVTQARPRVTPGVAPEGQKSTSSQISLFFSFFTESLFAQHLFTIFSEQDLFSFCGN